MQYLHFPGVRSRLPVAFRATASHPQLWDFPPLRPCTTASPRLCWQGSLTNKQTNRQTNKQTDSRKVVVSLMTVANCFGFTATTTTTTTHSQQLVAFSLLQGICDHGYVVYGRQSITHSSPFTPLQPCPHRLQSTGRHLNSVAYWMSSHTSLPPLSYRENSAIHSRTALLLIRHIWGMHYPTMRMICQARVTYVTITYNGHA